MAEIIVFAISLGLNGPNRLTKLKLSFQLGRRGYFIEDLAPLNGYFYRSDGELSFDHPIDVFK